MACTGTSRDWPPLLPAFLEKARSAIQQLPDAHTAQLETSMVLRLLPYRGSTLTVSPLRESWSGPHPADRKTHSRQDPLLSADRQSVVVLFSARRSLAVNFVNSVSEVLSCGPASLYESLENLAECTLALFVV